jgi:hypothetical protein
MYIEEKIASLTNGAVETEYPHVERVVAQPTSLTLYKNQFKMDQRI